MYEVKKDKYGERYVEVPVSFTLNVYLKDDVDEDEDEESADRPMEVDSSTVSEAIDQMERIELGEQVLNNIHLT